ncbi:MAG: hypothetical protein BroJett018_37770 [Chloroflexota bacterium]|nr:hypothetical protein [Chloroflexota bacterium]NOG64436.1 hypothetical protein [Chloroflexota bacterium]GIK65983.1 MAG: hypothetical protein BroJett018_37770 [Chloroflexota bacterium]
MNRQLDAAMVFLLLTIVFGLIYNDLRKEAIAAGDDSIESILRDDDEETKDWYSDRWQKKVTESLYYLAATGGCGLLTLILGVKGLDRYKKDKKQAKYDLEERRHQELLEATRQANRPPPVQERSRPSILYTSHPQPLTPAPPTIEQILSEAQRVYKNGNIKMAISLLETTNDPRAQKVLAKLRAMKK